jgi:hypothetical protein
MFKFNKINILISSTFLLALFLRILVMYYEGPIHNRIFSDMLVYTSIADEILRGNWNANHFFQSIGYPLIIAMTKKWSSNWGFILNVVQILASVGTLIYVYFLSSRCFGTKVGIISLLIGSIHVPWIYLPGFTLPENFFTFFLSAAGWYSYKILKGPISIFDCTLWALSFLCAFWLKGTHVLWGPFMFLGLMILKGRAAIKPMTVIGLIMVVGLCLHGGLTYSKIGKVQFSSSAGGLNFVEGKCPSKRNADSIGYWWQSPLYTQLHMNNFKKWDKPFTDSSHFMKEGLKCIGKNPMVLIQSFESIPYLFFGNRMWPLTENIFSHYFRFYEMFFSLFLVIGLAVMVRELFSDDLKLSEKFVWVLPILSLFLCVYIFKSELRYRIPFDVWFIPVSVKGWGILLEKRYSSEPLMQMR